MPWPCHVDLIKLDVQGMELEALEGAQQTIARCHPIFLLESRKAGRERLRTFLDGHGYKVLEAGYNLLAVHKSDPSSSSCSFPTCRRNRQPDRLTPSRRGPEAASARSRRRRAPP